MSKKINVYISGELFEGELAFTPEEKIKGLQGHEPLKDNQCMVFPFEITDKKIFHMATVDFAIDILFIENHTIKHIAHNIQEGDPRKFGATCNMVLELKGGVCKEKKIKEGSSVFIYY